MKKIGKKLNKKLKKSFAGKVALQGLFEKLHEFSLAGLNFGGGDNVQSSGEKNVIAYLASHIDKAALPVVFDVGANDGSCAKEVLSVFKDRVRLYCFEPSKKAFCALGESMSAYANVEMYNFGFGEADETVTIHADAEGSRLGSIFPMRAEHLGVDMSYNEKVCLRRLDDFCAEHKIGYVHLVKIDVEGGELGVLKGARSLIGSDSIGMIQFEFGGCNIASRTFFQDFFYLLDPKYRIYRVLKDGFAPVDRYKQTHEVFVTTNYMAVSRKMQSKKGC